MLKSVDLKNNSIRAKTLHNNREDKSTRHTYYVCMASNVNSVCVSHSVMSDPSGSTVHEILQARIPE